MLAAKLLGACGVDKLYVDDVFSAYTRTGTGASQVTTTNIDMTQGYMLWSKGRSGATDHAIYDSSRGVTKDLVSNTTAAETTQAQGLTAVSSTGHTMGTLAKVNTSTATYVDLVFRKAPKFFDVVTWTGNATNRTISHSLGQEVGLIFVKRTDSAADWQVYHRSLVNTEYMVLNSTAAKATGATRWNSTTPTTSVFSVGTDASVNASGGTYVAYLFAHDTGTDGIVQCGSYVGNGTATGPTVTLGWEPQYVMIKAASAGGSWRIVDSARGMVVGGIDLDLRANTSDAEYSIEQWVTPTATGFNTAGGNNNNTGVTYIYLAIRRPNKPPTVGTQVYNAIARTGTGAAATVTGVGFAPDLVALHSRSGTTGGRWEDRLRGATIELVPETTAAETTVAQSITSFNMDGFALGTDGDWNTNTATYINHFFKRAPGVFDQICFSGTGANKTESHGLTVAPELWLVKSRNGATQWVWGSSLLANTEKIVMPTPAGKVTDATAWNSTYPTSSVLSLGTAAAVNTNTATYAAYLWATKAGISKVFGYTGDGASGKVINCGFTTGARFILIVRTDTTGSIFVWDTIRGIIAGNDPRLCLDTTAAEVTTDDTIDPDTSGFIVNQLAATNINVTSATYIGLAFA